MCDSTELLDRTEECLSLSHTHALKSRGYVSQGQGVEIGWRGETKCGEERKGKDRKEEGKTSDCTLALGGRREQMSLTVQK